MGCHGPVIEGRRNAPTQVVPRFEPDQLQGFRIGVTADRRSDDLIAALERRGAEVLHAPTLRIVPAERDSRLVDDTKAVIDGRPDITLATTAFGMRGGSRRPTPPGWAPS